jgi:hypothetical protein
VIERPLRDAAVDVEARDAFGAVVLGGTQAAGGIRQQ